MSLMQNERTMWKDRATQLVILETLTLAESKKIIQVKKVNERVDTVCKRQASSTNHVNDRE